MYSSVKRGPFVARPLFEDEWVAVLSRQHPLSNRAFLRATDFRSETAILYSPLDRHMLVYRKFFRPVRSEPRKVLPVGLTEAMIEMAKANLGIAVLTRWSVEAEVRAGTLVALPLDRAGLHRMWHAVYRKQKGTPPYLHEFIRLLKTSFPVGPVLAAAAGAGA
jgi:LysR family transcriptional regulator for metE and metH